ncbi:ABC transporter permease [Weissella coleopterorum]|uniref:ABC transporter permease n=1 Tax=Weissella coleopterorum TaxID=2714949 RepID=A0A6G8AYV1_9LACO|nr:methionine ABC transporter permease [Weissella coleopterorum]QIL50132.1 ABC transporter permease [Weissella coleopterorum]
MFNWFNLHFQNIMMLGWGGDSGFGTALSQTLYMTIGSALIGGILGLSFGLGLVLTAASGLTPHARWFKILDFCVSVGRAIPFIIMVVVISPLTQLITQTTIGPTAALIPLAFGIFPFFARQVQVVLLSIDPGKIEAAQSYGATNWDIIWDVYLREGRAELIRISTVSLISLVGLTAMAGVIGAGGLGTTAIVTGYQRFQPDVMWLATILLLTLILIIQFSGDYLARKFQH